MEDLKSLVGLLCLRGDMPEQTMSLLLKHKDAVIAGEVVTGEWQADPVKSVRESLKKDWEKAVLRMNHRNYRLGEILKSDSGLAFKWLRKHLRQMHISYDIVDNSIKAIESLSIVQRQKILKILPDDFWNLKMIDKLIGDSLEIYQDLLNDKGKKDLHLLPLYGLKEGAIKEDYWNMESWLAKAKLALKTGYCAEEIAKAVFGHGWSWTGDISTMWGRWVDRFNVLCSNDNNEVRKIGEIGKKIAEESQAAALEEEKRKSIYGRT